MGHGLDFAGASTKYGFGTLGASQQQNKAMYIPKAVDGSRAQHKQPGAGNMIWQRFIGFYTQSNFCYVKLAGQIVCDTADKIVKGLCCE
jgi:hypothetical protein